MPSKQTETAKVIEDFIKRHTGEIYVRDRLDGKWGTYALSELPTSRALYWIRHWLKPKPIGERAPK